MCTGAELMLLSTVVSAGTAIQQGEQQKDWADYQSDQAQADATAERQASILQAEKIRKLAKKQQSEANAALAGSGVNTGEGTAVQINEEIGYRGESDAIMTIFGDQSSQYLKEAEGYKIKGQQAQNAGYLNASSSVLAGGYETSKWKKQK